MNSTENPYSTPNSKVSDIEKNNTLFKLVKLSFYVGAAVSIFMIALMAVSISTLPINFNITEMSLYFSSKIFLALSAVLIYKKYQLGLYSLYIAFAVSAIHTLYVLGILDQGKRHIGAFSFLSSPYEYWIYKGTIFIAPLLFYLIWIHYWRKVSLDKQDF